MNNRKLFALVLVVAVAGLVMVACMRDDASDSRLLTETAPTAAPGATAVPGATAAPGSLTGASGSTAGTANGALSTFDWANGAADIEAAIAQLSEISEARVVVVDSTALVGVKFDSAYKGEITERIREMVAAEVLKADPTIQTVAVTATDADVRKVYGLSDSIRAGRAADELAADINAIVRNATTLR